MHKTLIFCLFLFVCCLKGALRGRQWVVVGEKGWFSVHRIASKLLEPAEDTDFD